MKKVFSILLAGLIGSLLLPIVALAATVEGMTQKVVDVTLKIGVAAVVVFWVITGILFLSAQGAPEKLSTAKKALFMAIAGTVIIILAATAINFVGQALGI